jgi:hypothetical protein
MLDILLLISKSSFVLETARPYYKTSNRKRYGNIPHFQKKSTEIHVFM